MGSRLLRVMCGALVAATGACSFLLGEDFVGPPDAEDSGMGVDVDVAPDAPADGMTAVGCGDNCEVIAQNQNQPTDIVIHKGSLYWLNSSANGSLVRCPLPSCGGGPVTRWGNLTNPKGLMISSFDDAYYAHGGTVDEIELLSTVSDAGPYQCSNTFGAVAAFTLANGDLTWAPTTDGPGQIRLDDSCTGGFDILRDGQTGITSMASEAAVVWWASGLAGGAVQRCTVTNCAGTSISLADGIGIVHSMAVDVTSVYATIESTPGRVVKIAKSSPFQPVVELATGLGRPWGIAVAGFDIYVTTYTGGELVKLSTQGGEKKTILSGLQGPWGVAVDATHVYLTEYGAGRVLRVPR